MKEVGKVSGISRNDGYSTIQHKSCSQNHKIDFLLFDITHKKIGDANYLASNKKHHSYSNKNDP